MQRIHTINLTKHGLGRLGRYTIQSMSGVWRRYKKILVTFWASSAAHECCRMFWHESAILKKGQPLSLAEKACLFLGRPWVLQLPVTLIKMLLTHHGKSPASFCQTWKLSCVTSTVTITDCVNESGGLDTWCSVDSYDERRIWEDNEGKVESSAKNLPFSSQLSKCHDELLCWRSAER